MARATTGDAGVSKNLAPVNFMRRFAGASSSVASYCQFGRRSKTQDIYQSQRVAADEAATRKLAQVFCFVR